MGLGGAVDLPAIRQRILVDDSALSGLGARFGRIGGALGTAVAGGAAIAAGGVAAFAAVGVRGAIDVERGIAEVVTLFGETGEAGARLGEELATGVADLSDNVGIAQDALVGGLYQAISAGVPRDNAFDFLEVASRASIAGVTDVETAIDGITTTINAFGLETSDAEAVSDSMFAAVQGGKTTFEELSASMSNIAPAAAAAGVGFDEVNAGIATLTAAGVPTAQATTQLRAALVGLQRPSEEMDEIFQALGYTNAQTAIEAEGLGFALDAVSDAADGDNGRLTTLLGSVEAVGAANVLAGTGAEKFAEELARQEGSAGAAADAFDTMNETTARSMEQIKTQLTNAAITVGSVLLPPIQRLLEVLLENLGPAIEAVSGFLSGLGERVDGLGGSTSAVAEILSAVWTTIVETVGAAIEIVKAIIDDVRATLEDNADRIRDTFDNARERISSIMESISAIVSGILEVIQLAWEMFGDDVIRFVTDTFDAILRIIDGVMRVIRGIIDVVVGLITGDWQRAWDGVKGIVQGVWDVIKGIVDRALSTVRLAIDVVLSAISGIFGNIWGAIVDAVSGAWTSITGFVTGGIESMQESISSGLDDAIGWFRELPDRILGALGDLGTMLLDAGRQIIGGLIDGIRDAIGGIGDAVGEAAQTVRDFWPFSPAKTGPLSGSGSPDRAGRKIGTMLADGMLDSTRKIAGASATLAGAATIDATGRLAASASRAGTLAAAGGTTYNIGDVILPNVTDRSTADDLIAGLRQAVRQGAAV